MRNRFRTAPLLILGQAAVVMRRNWSVHENGPNRAHEFLQ
jgi:hypothetical protein